MNAVDDGWAPLTPRDAVELLAGLRIAWWVAGGWALELAGAEAPRRHGDLDVAILRPEHEALRDELEGWDLRIAHRGALRPWTGGVVELPANAVWARPRGEDRWFFDFKIELVDGGDWVYRRDRAFRRPLATIGRTTRDGIPYLAPEIATLYARG